MREIIITPQTAGGRLDKLLIRYLDKAGQSFVYKMLRKKNITLNDKKADGSYILQDGDSIKLYLAEETIEKFHSDANEKHQNAGHDQGNKKQIIPEIIFEDENILAVNKPAGMLSQKVKNTDYSVNDFFLTQISQTDVFRPGIANRLDRNTSGLMLAGKNPAAARDLSKALKERTISKKYLTLVCGHVENGRRLEGTLSKDKGHNTVKIDEGGETVITEYVPLEGNSQFTLLEVDLITGKSHQIRAHLAFIGHPIAGDPKYGDKDINSRLKKKYDLKHQLLHAYKVEFQQMSGILTYLNGTVIEAPLPDRFCKILKSESVSSLE